MVYLPGQVYKVKSKIMPEIPEVPNEEALKLKEFFTWKRRHFMTQHEIDSLLEQFKQEISSSVNAMLRESEMKINTVRDEMIQQMEKLNEKSKSESELLHDEITRKVSEVEDGFNAAVNGLKNRIEELNNDITNKLSKITEDFSSQLEELKNDIDDSVNEKEKLLKENDEKIKEETEEFANQLVSDKFDELNKKLMQLNTKFYEFKESNDMELIEKEFQKRTQELEKSFKQFQNITEGLNEEIKAEMKDLRDTIFPEFKEEMKQNFEAFKTEINEQFKSLDPNAVAEATEQRLNKKIDELKEQIEDLQVNVKSLNEVATKEELQKLHDNFARQMKKVIEWINYFNSRTP